MERTPDNITPLTRPTPTHRIWHQQPITNNTAELLARILTCDIIPANMPAIIIYDSTVVYSQHFALLTDACTNRQRTRTVLPDISHMLAQRLAATQPAGNHPRAPSVRAPTHPIIRPLPLHDTITAHIRQFSHPAKTGTRPNTLPPLIFVCS